MIAITNPATTPAAELPPASAANAPAAASFADQLATESSSSSVEVEPDFFVDFHDRPGGPARAHEVRLQGGDCTTEIFQ
jgi:hypothetical protein